MIINSTPIKDLIIINQIFLMDNRGLFYQQYRLDELNFNAVQSNISISHKNVLRGLHYQTGKFAQAKIISLIQGHVLQVSVDLRVESPTYMHYYKVELNTKTHLSILVPRGFANAILSLADNTIVHYLLDNSYSASHEAGLLYNDPKLDIDWPKREFIVSEKDKSWTLL